MEKLITLLMPLLIALTSEASLTSDRPREDYDANCKPLVTRLVKSILDSGSISTDGQDYFINEAEANEKNISLSNENYDRAKQQGKYEAVYSSVNRDIGYNIEGEWQITFTVSTLLESDECQIISSSFSVGLPKPVRK